MRERLTLLLATVVALTWLAIGLVSLGRDSWTGFTIVTPAMLIVLGYFMGRRGNGPKGGTQ